MPSIQNAAPSCTPVVAAGLFVLLHRLLAPYRIALPDVTAVTAALGVSRSRAYELADQIDDAICELPRSVGRPARPEGQDEAYGNARYAIACAVRDFLATHPGCVDASGTRRRYSDPFRRFVIGLGEPGQPGAGLPLPRFAEACSVPGETLRDWLAGGRETTDEVLRPEELATDPGVGVIAQIRALWRTWNGSLKAFRRVLREQHRIYLSLSGLRDLVVPDGRRKRPPRRVKPDPEAIRGAFERFFPGAQWVADGKALMVTIDRGRFAFNWELIVDGDTGALVGFEVTDVEDGDALIDAVDNAILTTGAAPQALLSDNRPSNHSPEIHEALEQRGILPMPSTPGRPENKASVEGAFGLFAQTMPLLELPVASPRERARQFATSVLFAYAAGRNHAPRAGLGGKSAAQRYAEVEPTEQERQQAQQRLTEIKRRIEQRRDTDRRRADPVCRRILEQAFTELALCDPEHHFIPAIARCGLDAALEALAVFRARLEAGASFDCGERYLLGIARNVAQRDEDLAVYEHLVELRLRANDLLLEPLRSKDRRRHEQLGTIDYIDAALEDALAAEATIDRIFWRARFLAALERLPPTSAHVVIRRSVKLVATSYQTAPSERDVLIARLAAIEVTRQAA